MISFPSRSVPSPIRGHLEAPVAANVESWCYRPGYTFIHPLPEPRWQGTRGGPIGQRQPHPKSSFTPPLHTKDAAPSESRGERRGLLWGG